MATLKVLGLCGSLRRGSFNRRALALALEMARGRGATATEADLRELNLPMYDGDIEAAGLPEPVRQLKAAIEGCDVLLIASPEYNYSVTPPLKNAIDWASRQGNSFNGKVAAIFGVSNGRFGTVRGQNHLRQVLSSVNVLAVPQPQCLIGPAEAAFGADGQLVDAKAREVLERLVTAALSLAERLAT